MPSTLLTPRSLPAAQRSATRSPLPASTAKATREVCLPTLAISARRCTGALPPAPRSRPPVADLSTRQPEHVIQFLFAELGTSGSVDGAGRLVIKGRFQQKQIENVLRRYIGALTRHSPVVSCSMLTLAMYSRIRHLQDVQVPGYTPHKGQPYLFRHLPNVRPRTLRTSFCRKLTSSPLSCGSSRSVAAIKSGFQAQIGRRKAQAAKKIG
jgi:hypothetical protein